MTNIRLFFYSRTSLMFVLPYNSVIFSFILLKSVIKHPFLSPSLADIRKSRTFATVFFIVLDLRLTKVGVQRYSFFFAFIFIIKILLNSQIKSTFAPQNNLSFIHLFFNKKL